MIRKAMTLIALIAVASFISGCGGKQTYQTESLLEKNWGRSYETAKHNQILNPDAGKNLEPVEGLDGEAADSNMNEYRKSFAGKPTGDVYNFNLGAISGVGGGKPYTPK